MIDWRHPLVSPWYTHQVVGARFLVNLASLIWAVAIISIDNALLKSGSAYAWITEYIGENWIAWPLGIGAACQIVWQICLWPPLKYGSIGYGAMAFFWMFVWLSIMYSGLFLGRPVQATSSSWLAVGTLLAFYGWISNPKAGVGNELV